MSGNGDIENPNAWAAGGAPLSVGSHSTPPEHGDIPNPNAWANGGTPLSVGSLTTPTGHGDIPNPRVWEAADSLPAPILVGGYNFATAVASLSWSLPGGPWTVLHYLVYRSVDGGAYSVYATQTGTTFSEGPLDISHTYRYYIVAVPIAGFVSAPSTIYTVASYSLPAPVLSGAYNYSNDTVPLSWTVAGGPWPIQSYSVYRAVNGGAYSLLVTQSGTSYTNTGLSSANVYTYYVVATPLAGPNSANSNIVTAPVVQTFTYLSNATWTKPANFFKAVATTIGGGGGGSGADESATSGVGALAGYGGGGGGYAKATLFAADIPGSSVAVTVGQGGAGGAGTSTTATAGADGGDGGDSSFGSFMVGHGGTGGKQAGGTRPGTGGTGVVNTGSSPTTDTGGNGNGAYGNGHGGSFPGAASAGGLAGGGGGGGGYNNFDPPGADGYPGGAGSVVGGLGGSYTGTSPSPPGQAGTDGTTAGGGGGGGGARAPNALTAGNGGAGGACGGGGGGGGGGQGPAGGTSGSGGPGGGGKVIVVSYS